MNRFKDFIYDKSDIFVALVIVSIAGLVIFSRIDAILDYPETFASTAPATSESGIVNEAENATPTAVVIPTEEEIEMLAVYINYGESLQVIADKFVSVSLFETADDFFTAVETSGAATQIKTGNFIIPSDATPEEVMAIITNPGL